jgi:hypothetical protein
MQYRSKCRKNESDPRLTSPSVNSSIKLNPLKRLTHNEKQAAPNTLKITVTSAGDVAAAIGSKITKLIKIQKTIKYYKVSLHQVFSSTDIGDSTSMRCTIW